MNVVAIAGVATQAKIEYTLQLAEHLLEKCQTVTILDNGDVPMRIAELTSKRLRGGCVCCTIAPELIKQMGTLTTDWALIIVTASADALQLRHTLSRLEYQGHQVTVAAILDPGIKPSYLSDQIVAVADVAVNRADPAEVSLQSVLSLHKAS